MTQISKPYTFSNGTTADANQVDQNFDALFNLVNGGIDSSNITDGSIATVDLANESVTTAKTEGIPYATDLFGTSGFVQSGLTATKDGTNANQVDIATGVAWILQSDGSLRRFSIAATNFKTVSASATYYLDLNPDGTFSWATGHSIQSNYITICTVTSDASSNVNVITDTRPRGPFAVLASAVAFRDPNGNVVSNYSVANNQNPNLLFNPNGELGLQGWNAEGGSSWSASFSSYGVGSTITSPYHGSNTGVFEILDSTLIPATAGVSFIASYYIYTGNMSAGSAYTNIQYIQSDKSTVINNFDSSHVNYGNGSWQRITIPFTTPTNTAYIRLRLVTSSDMVGTAQFRQGKVEVGTIATSFSDDSTLNTVQYASVNPFASTVGTYTFSSGALNKAVGTVINILAVGVSNFFNVISNTGNYLNVVGSTFNGVSRWSYNTSGAYPYVGFANVNASSGTNTFTLYDGSYSAVGYFQINNGYLQFVITGGGSSNATAASSLQIFTK